MQYTVLAMVLLLGMINSAFAQIPTAQGVITLPSNNVAIVLVQRTQPNGVNYYSGKTPAAYVLAGGYFASAGTLYQSGSNVRLDVSVSIPSGPGGADSARYETTGALSGNVTLNFVSGSQAVAWPASITLAGNTVGTPPF